MRNRVGSIMAVALAMAPLGTPAAAQVCGDADGDRRVSLTDGVQHLRAAAQLPGLCTATTCDVDGNGAVTLTDGVNVLRSAAGLPAQLGCGTEIIEVFQGVGATSGVDDTVLDVGLAPVPGAPSTLGEPVGRSTVDPGRNVSYSIAYEVDPGLSDPSLLVAVRDAETGVPLRGFFDLALPDSSGVAEFQLLTAEVGTEVLVEFFTRAGGQVSAASGIDLRISSTFFCCPIPMCVEGANAGSDCAADGDCPGGFCTDSVGCAGGPNDERLCVFNSECPDGFCVPD